MTKKLAAILMIGLAAIFGSQHALCASTSNTKQTATSKSSKSKASTNKNDKLNKLKQEKTNVDNEVKRIDGMLTDAKKTTKQSLKELERINANIHQRNEVIEKQGKEIQEQEENIDRLNNEILQMEMNYNVAKRKYVELVYHAYQKNNVYDRLLFVFSAKNMQESVYRFDYIRKLAAVRRQQAADINTTKIDLEQKKKELEDSKTRAEFLLEEREQEKAMLENEKQSQTELVRSLKKQEKQLLKELERQRKASEAINKKIQDVIAQEAAKAEAEAKAKEKAKTKTNTGKQNTTKNSAQGQNSSKTSNKQQQANTNTTEPSEFAKVMGRMHWPVWRGTITGHFGNQPHPVLKNVMVENKGVYITSPAETDAISVFEGKVTQVFSIPGSNNAIILRHGNYLTVYANLTNIYVKQGQEVKRGDKLGKIYIDPDDSKHAVLFFQIWKEKMVQNPENWLRPLK